jgi:hypothetical protein
MAFRVPVMTGRPWVLALLPVLLLIPVGTPTPAHAEDGPTPQTNGLLRFDKTTHDFGDVAQNREYVGRFTFENTGKTPITGLVAIADCGCYGANLSTTTLQPGTHGGLTVRFRTLTFSGSFTKHATLRWTEGATKRQQRLALKVAVRSGVILEPGRLHFGEILEGRVPPPGTLHALYYEGVGQPFEVKGLRIEAPGFAPAQVTPYRDPRDPRFKGHAVTLTFQKPPPRGLFVAEAVLETDHPEYPRVPVRISANIIGPVYIQQPHLHLGLVPQGQVRTVKTLVRPAEAGIDLGAVSAKARGGRLQAVLEPAPAQPGAYTLEISLPKDAAVGRIDEIIEVRTQVPNEPMVEVRVKGRVFTPRGS